jgi:hypothetical protein
MLRKIPSALALAAIALCGADAATAALVQRTFVASYGVDINPCLLAAPCRTFTAAIAVTAPGGDVVVLDSAGYGPFVVDKSLTITAPAGIYAGVTASSGRGIQVNGGNIVVALRGLAVTGQGGSNGISFDNGRRLTLERVTIANFNSNGFYMGAYAQAVLDQVRSEGNGGAGAVIVAGTATITDSTFAGNAGSGLQVVSQQGQAVRVNAVRATIAENGNHGVDVSTVGGTAGSSLALAVEQSVIRHNFDSGVLATGAPGMTAQVVLSGSVISDHLNPTTGRGVLTAGNPSAQSATGLVLISGNLVTGNHVGVDFTGFGVATTGDNAVSKNGADTNGPAPATTPTI